MARAADSARRILEVQKQLHRIEELGYARLRQREAELDGEQLALMNALSEDGALHGLFVDMTARRLRALRQEASRLVPELESKARSLAQTGGRVRNAERLVEGLELEERRARERKELEEVIETRLVLEDASLKQDQ